MAQDSEKNETSIPTREPRAFLDDFLDLLKTHRRAFAVGVVAVSLVLGGALFVKNRDTQEPRAVAATQPTAAPSSEPTPIETAAPSPSDIPEAPVAPTPSELLAIASNKLDTDVVLPPSFFPGLIEESRVHQLESEYPDLSSMISPYFMMNQVRFTPEDIRRYQIAFKNAYGDPDVRSVLGSPQGMMSAKQLLSSTDKEETTSLIPLTADKFVENIAQGVKDNKPGANSSLAELVSLDPGSVDLIRERINSGVAKYAQATRTDLLAVQEFRILGNNQVTLLAALTTYDNAHKVLHLYTLVTVDSNDSFVALPYDTQNISELGQ